MTDKKKPDLYVIEGDSEAVKPKATAKKRRLTAKQEKFLKAMIQGATQADAMRASRDCSKWKPSAIYTEAHRLMSHPEIHRRLTMHQASKERAAQSSEASRRLWVLEQLQREASDMSEGSPASRVRAIELIGKTQGMFTDVVENNQQEASEDELRQQLENKLTQLLQGSG